MKFYISLIILFFPLFVFSQSAIKDTRPKEQKEDPYNAYNAENIDKTTLLKALHFAGINVFNIPLNKFNKSYHLEIDLDEYVDGENIHHKNISVSDNNKYTYFPKNNPKNKMLTNYIDQIIVYSKDQDTVDIIRLETYAGGISGIKLRNDSVGASRLHFYDGRRYGKTVWVLNKQIPVLIYASSWYDKENDVERFCGAVDLSRNEKETKELLEKSPHYYVISYKVSNE
jgi:hypothetical protein